MDRAYKELLVARICSGCVRVKVFGRRGREKTYVVRRPTRDELYVANEIYFEVLRESELEGLYSDSELLQFLLENDFWDEQRQKLLESLPKEIEQFKLKLYKATFRSNERKVVRKALEIAKSRFAQLHEQRNAYNHLSCSGAAALAKARYILGCSLYTTDGKRVFSSGDDFYMSESKFLDDVMSEYAKTRLEEAVYREIARTEPWRTIWNAHKVEGSVFGVAPADYTEEQVALVNWTSLYDNIFQHPECPPDAVIEDDDLMDGWMIDQRQQREARIKKAEGEEVVGNERIRNSQEVYIVAETTEDARKVFDLNDEFGKTIQKQRFSLLREKGQVNELDMPDTRQRLRMEVTQKLSEAMKMAKNK